MVYEVETGDVFRAAYLVSRGARVVKSAVQGGDHVVLTLLRISAEPAPCFGVNRQVISESGALLLGA